MTGIHTPALIGSLLLAATAAPPPHPTERDIQPAEAVDSLESRYEQLATELATLDPSSKKAAETRELLDAIGARLTDQMAERVRADLAKNLLPSDRYPLDVLDQQIARIADVEDWDSARYSKAADILQAERRRTTDEIGATERELGTLSHDQTATRLHLLGELTELLGPGSAAYAGHAAERTQILDRLIRQAEQAMKREEYEAAQQALTLAAEASPDDERIQELLGTTEMRLFERDFRGAVDAGDFDEAYSQLEKMADGPRAEEVRRRLEDSAQRVADYLTALAVADTNEQRYPDAYRRFSQARGIQRMIGAGEPVSRPEEAEFLQMIVREYSAAQEAGLHGLAWGLIQVLEAFDLESVTLPLERRETRERVLDLAIARLTTAPFEDESGAASRFADALGDETILHVYELIPGDVRVIEPGGENDTVREQPMGSQDPGPSPAHYRLGGTIFEARVESSQVQVSRKMSAATGQEDISFEATLHRKVGSCSVSYQLTDSRTASVKFADSARSTAEYEGDSHERVERGDFSVEPKAADLPPDSEILDRLLDTVSEQIGGRLAEVLANPERGYREAGDRLAAEARYLAASRQYAFASVLFERKGRDSEELNDSLRRASVAAISLTGSGGARP